MFPVSRATSTATKHSPCRSIHSSLLAPPRVRSVFNAQLFSRESPAKVLVGTAVRSEFLELRPNASCPLRSCDGPSDPPSKLLPPRVQYNYYIAIEATEASKFNVDDADSQRSSSSSLLSAAFPTHSHGSAASLTDSTHAPLHCPNCCAAAVLASPCALPNLA